MRTRQEINFIFLPRQHTLRKTKKRLGVRVEGDIQLFEGDI